MTWMIGLAGIVAAILFASFCYQSYQNKVTSYMEAVRVHVKAQGGQEVDVQRVAAPHLTGAMLFSVQYLDVEGRQIMNKVTVHTAGEYENNQFWGDPVTPV